MVDVRACLLKVPYQRIHSIHSPVPKAMALTQRTWSQALVVSLMGIWLVEEGPHSAFAPCSMQRLPGGGRWATDERSVQLRAMDNIYSIFHPNLERGLSKEEKRACMDKLLEMASAQASAEGYALGKEVQDFHRRKGWSTKELKKWFEKHRNGLWCQLDISAAPQTARSQLTVISATVWGYRMEVHLSLTTTNTKIVVVKDLTNLKLFCAVAGIGYVKTLGQ